MEYLLSIIIPTKNRQKYCLAAVKQVLSLKSPKIQIVVQDNSDSSILGEEIKKFETEQVQYHYESKTLSFTDNFSEAIDSADGEYLCIIGDDDGVLNQIVDVVEYAHKNQLDAIIPALNAVYVWPMEHSFIHGGDNGYLCVSYLKAKVDQAEIKKGLEQLLKNGGQNYQKYDLPRIYHGIVHRRMVEKVKQQTGTYFGGLTPDIYMSTALAIVCQKVVRLGFPITVSGICTGSGSSNSATGKHTGQLKDAPHFVGHKNYRWSPQVPAIYTVETIWADTVLHALQDFNDERYNQFSVASLVAICRYKYPQFKNELDAFTDQYGIPHRTLHIKSFSFIMVPFIKRIIKRIVLGKSAVVKYYGVNNIIAAVELTENELNKHLKDCKSINEEIITNKR